MKYLIIVMTLFFSSYVFSGTVDCGIVTIEQILAGPRHGAMIHVNDSSCGNGGWICLDPEGQYLSKEVSSRVYSLVLAFHLSNKPVKLAVYDGTFPSACGGYPALEDIRTPEN